MSSNLKTRLCHAMKVLFGRSPNAARGPRYPTLRFKTFHDAQLLEFGFPPGEKLSEFFSKNPRCVELARLHILAARLKLTYQHESADTTSGFVACLVIRVEGAASITVNWLDLPTSATYSDVVSSAVYKEILASWGELLKASSSSRGQGMPLWGSAALVGLTLLCGALLFSSPQARGPSPSASAAPADAPVQLSKGDQLNATEKVVLAKVVTQSGIELATGGSPFIIFSDPNCPACRELEAKLATLDKSLSPIVVPVSFKDKSPEIVAGVLCAPNVTAAWRAAAGGASIALTAPCSKGEAQARENNAAFMALKFDKTPTIVTSTGKVAVGAKDFDGLVKWLKENSGV